MKLLKNTEDDNVFLTKNQWIRVLTAVSVMTIVMYIVAMVFSLCGSKYFILNYQNTQIDNIENWLKERHIYSLIAWAFSTLEFSIIMTYILQKPTKIWYILAFYSAVIPAFFIDLPDIFYYAYPFLFYLIVPVIERRFKKDYLHCFFRLLIATGVSLVLQLMIYVIKAGQFSTENHIMNLSAHFIYAIENDIALSVLLFTISLYAYREKGDNVWTICHSVGGFSQTSKTNSQKSYSKTNLTKLQRNKIVRFYVKLYVIQVGGFLLLMVLPFLLGKVFEFLVMYLSFAIVRYLLGFKYSLHFKKETLCITVGAVVFGILSLVVPFFYAVVIAAILLGVGLAVLLHLSYKYKGMVLFNKVARPDKFALLYTFFDGDLSEHHVKKICCLKGLDLTETGYIWDFVQGNKISYLAWKYNYSHRMFIYKLDEAIAKLTAK